jgi:hypothetical protein
MDASGLTAPPAARARTRESVDDISIPNTRLRRRAQFMRISFGIGRSAAATRVRAPGPRPAGVIAARNAAFCAAMTKSPDDSADARREHPFRSLVRIRTRLFGEPAAIPRKRDGELRREHQLDPKRARRTRPALPDDFDAA